MLRVMVLIDGFKASIFKVPQGIFPHSRRERPKFERESRRVPLSSLEAGFLPRSALWTVKDVPEGRSSGRGGVS